MGPSCLWWMGCQLVVAQPSILNSLFLCVHSFNWRFKLLIRTVAPLRRNATHTQLHPMMERLWEQAHTHMPLIPTVLLPPHLGDTVQTSSAVSLICPTKSSFLPFWSLWDSSGMLSRGSSRSSACLPRLKTRVLSQTTHVGAFSSNADIASQWSIASSAQPDQHFPASLANLSPWCYASFFKF